MSIIIPASAPFPLQWSAIFQILPIFISLYNIRFLVLRNDRRIWAAIRNNPLRDKKRGPPCFLSYTFPLSIRDIAPSPFYFHECFSHFASSWFFVPSIFPVSLFPSRACPFSRERAIPASPPSPTCFSTILPGATMGTMYIYIYISDTRLAARLASPARRVGNVMQINDKSEMVDVNKNLTRRKNWKGGRLFCEAKGCCCCFCRLGRRPIWNFSSAAITDTAICNFARDSTNSTFQTFIYPIYSSLPSSILHLSDYL